MKSYTDLEQSKKLAEILPLESADMYIYKNVFFGALSCFNGSTMVGKYIKLTDKEKAYPCWSLAALFEEIPKIIDFEDDESDYALEILKENGLYYLSYGNPLEHSRIEIEPQGHFVDACVTMIEKLHELKML